MPYTQKYFSPICTEICNCNRYSTTIGPSNPTPGHASGVFQNLKDTGTLAISAPQGTIAKSGKQLIVEDTDDGHNAVFLKHKEVGNNAKFSHRKESRDDHSK